MIVPHAVGEQSWPSRLRIIVHHRAGEERRRQEHYGEHQRRKDPHRLNNGFYPDLVTTSCGSSTRRPQSCGGAGLVGRHSSEEEPAEAEESDVRVERWRKRSPKCVAIPRCRAPRLGRCCGRWKTVSNALVEIFKASTSAESGVPPMPEAGLTERLA